MDKNLYSKVFFNFFYSASIFTLQMISWKIINGSYLLIPQGKTFLLDTKTHFIENLLSPNNGILFWCPIILLSFIGLVLLIKDDPQLSIPSIVFLITLYTQQSLMSDWYGGGGFGPRRFTAGFILFLVGLAQLYKKIKFKKFLVILILILIIWNLHLFIQYNAGKIQTLRQWYKYKFIEILKGRTNISLTMIKNVVLKSHFYESIEYLCYKGNISYFLIVLFLLATSTLLIWLIVKFIFKFLYKLKQMGI